MYLIGDNQALWIVPLYYSWVMNILEIRKLRLFYFSIIFLYKHFPVITLRLNLCSIDFNPKIVFSSFLWSTFSSESSFTVRITASANILHPRSTLSCRYTSHRKCFFKIEQAIYMTASTWNKDNVIGASI